MIATARPALWWHDPATRRFILLGYLPWLGGLNLVWEIAHLPLYTIWYEASASYAAFAVAHCTIGDVLIGASSLALVLIIGRLRPLATWPWRRVAGFTVLLGTGFTAFSEWLSVDILQNWAYAERMPVITLGSVRLGLSPLLQWIVIPPLALYLARKTILSRRKSPRRSPMG